MKIKTITFKQVRNLGNYESRTIEIFAELDEGDDIDENIEYIKAKVIERLRNDYDYSNPDPYDLTNEEKTDIAF